MARRRKRKLKQSKSARAARRRYRANKRAGTTTRRRKRRGARRGTTRRRGRGGARGVKYAVKCGKRVVSRHRKKSAANTARGSRKGCRVVRTSGTARRKRRRSRR